MSILTLLATFGQRLILRILSQSKINHRRNPTFTHCRLWNLQLFICLNFFSSDRSISKRWLSKGLLPITCHRLFWYRMVLYLSAQISAYYSENCLSPYVSYRSWLFVCCLQSCKTCWYLNLFLIRLASYFIWTNRAVVSIQEVDGYV